MADHTTFTRILITAAVLAGTLAGCGGDVSSRDKDGGGGDGGGGLGTPDRIYARSTYKTLTDIQQRVLSTSCAAQDNNCHWNDAYPQLTSEANLISLTRFRCNDWRSDGRTYDDFCEKNGDILTVGMAMQPAIDAGLPTVTGMSFTVGRVEAVHMVPADLASPIVAYEIIVKETVPVTTDAGAPMPVAFSLLHFGQSTPYFIQSMPGATFTDKPDRVRIALNRLPEDKLVNIVPGDPNGNGKFGTGNGFIVVPGDANNSYLTIRLLGPILDSRSKHPRMPLEPVAMSPVNVSPYLGPTEMYAIKSWINCMSATDTATVPINYDCAANMENNTKP